MLEKILCDSLNLLRVVLWPVVWCVLYVLWVLEKNGYSAVGWCVLFCKCGLNSFGDCVDRGVEINHVASTDTVKG